MKHPFIIFFVWIITFSVICSLIMMLGIWLISPKLFSFEIIIKYVKVGTLCGIWIGGGGWFTSYMQARKYNNK